MRHQSSFPFVVNMHIHTTLICNLFLALHKGCRERCGLALPPQVFLPATSTAHIYFHLCAVITSISRSSFVVVLGCDYIVKRQGSCKILYMQRMQFIMQANIWRCVYMIRIQLYCLRGRFKYLFIVNGQRLFSFVNIHMHVIMVWNFFMNNEKIISLILEGMPSITLFFFISIPFLVVPALSVQQQHHVIVKVTQS